MLHCSLIDEIATENMVIAAHIRATRATCSRLSPDDSIIARALRQQCRQEIELLRQNRDRVCAIVTMGWANVA